MKYSRAHVVGSTEATAAGVPAIIEIMRVSARRFVQPALNIQSARWWWFSCILYICGNRDSCRSINSSKVCMRRSGFGGEAPSVGRRGVPLILCSPCDKCVLKVTSMTALTAVDTTWVDCRYERVVVNTYGRSEYTNICGFGLFFLQLWMRKISLVSIFELVNMFIIIFSNVFFFFLYFAGFNTTLLLYTSEIYDATCAINQTLMF